MVKRDKDQPIYNPKVSIVIPAYNASNYLAEAIDSALSQTYKNIEIIVVNDGSRDDGATERVALSYCDQIKYFYKENGGSSSALNMGIANMTGEWFSWLSHDDLYVPEKLERQIAYLASLQLDNELVKKQVLFSSSELIDANGRTIRGFKRKTARKLSRRVDLAPHNGYLIAEPTGFLFHGCSCLVHRDVFDEIGGLDEGLRLLNDVDLWFRIYAKGYKIHYVPEPLVKGRVHAAQVSKSIGYSYHNPEQDMFWNRSLDWLIENYPDEDILFYRFGRNAFLKTRYLEGKRAYDNIEGRRIKKAILSLYYRTVASLRQFCKSIYLKIKCK